MVEIMTDDKQETRMKLSCTQCGKISSQPQNLQTHMVICGVKKAPKPKGNQNKVTVSDHKCEPCDKYFFDKHQMTGHNRRQHQQIFQTGNNVITTYTPEINKAKTKKKKKFYCDICDAVLSRAINITHMKTHFDRSECCKHCNLSFMSSLATKKHMLKSHTKIAVSCEVCLKEFPRMKDNKSHFKRVHCLETFKCSKCYRIFKLKWNFEMHKKMCESIKDPKPFGQLTGNGRRKRLKEILRVISCKYIFKKFDKRRDFSFYNSLQEISMEEKKGFQDNIAANFHIIGEATEKEVLTVNHVIDLFRERWIDVNASSLDLECEYCGEQAKSKNEIQLHENKCHPTQISARQESKR